MQSPVRANSSSSNNSLSVSIPNKGVGDMDQVTPTPVRPTNLMHMLRPFACHDAEDEDFAMHDCSTDSINSVDSPVVERHIPFSSLPMLYPSSQKLQHVEIARPSYPDVEVDEDRQDGEGDHMITGEASDQSEICSTDNSTLQLLDMPFDVLSHICDFLNPADLCRVSQVCRSLYHASMDEEVWRQRVVSRFPYVYFAPEDRNNWKYHYSCISKSLMSIKVFSMGRTYNIALPHAANVRDLKYAVAMAEGMYAYAQNIRLMDQHGRNLTELSLGLTEHYSLSDGDAVHLLPKASGCGNRLLSVEQVYPCLDEYEARTDGAIVVEFSSTSGSSPQLRRAGATVLRTYEHGSPLPLAGTQVLRRRKLSFIPTNMLNPNTEYRVVLSLCDLLDEVGDPVMGGEVLSWSFRTTSNPNNLSSDLNF